MHLIKIPDRRVELKLYHLLWLATLLLVSCSGVLYKVSHQKPIIVESIVVDTIIQKQWYTKTDKTEPIVSIQKQKEIINNLQTLLNKSKKGEKLSEWDLFRLEVWKIAEEIKEENNLVNASQFQIYDWSMKLFWHESRFNPKAKNSINAQGLFQAMTFVRKQLGFPSNLYQQSATVQIKCYKKYINYCLKMVDPTKINSAGDWYMLGLYPAHADKADNTVFGSKKGSKTLRANYRCNKGLDKNRDGIITKGEIEQKLLSHFI